MAQSNISTRDVDHPAPGGVADVADEVNEAVADKPWIEAVTRAGWVAKGAVYLLMGLTAFAIARRRPTDDEASPEGALGQVIQNPGGRVILVVLAIGLLLYTTWRFLTAALIRGNEPRDWLARVGYAGSGTFYALLAWVALRSALRDERAQDSNAIERLSANLLGNGWGRWLLGLLGLAIVGVGIYFLVEKSARRSFLDELSLAGASFAERRAIVVSGVVGWFGRGVVTVLVGFFVADAAIESDTSEARGFDKAVRELATSAPGRLAVGVVGLGLCLYGVFCLISTRRQVLDDHS